MFFNIKLPNNVIRDVINTFPSNSKKITQALNQDQSSTTPMEGKISHNPDKPKMVQSCSKAAWGIGMSLVLDKITLSLKVLLHWLSIFLELGSPLRAGFSDGQLRPRHQMSLEKSDLLTMSYI